jgi:hypothetical protein
MAKPKRIRSTPVDRGNIGPHRYGNTPEKRKIVHQYLTYQEANEGWYRAFNKCQLAYDEKGRRYRTNIPRVLPNLDDFELSKKRGRKDGEVY